MLPIFDVVLQNSFSSTKSESFILLAVYDIRNILLNPDISNSYVLLSSPFSIIIKR